MDQTSVISLDTIKFLTSDGLKLFTNNILSIIEDNEYVTATAITDLNDRLLIVENNNSGSIITEADITAWGFTKNTGTITGVSANGTSVATSGVANIPAATTSKYGVTKLSDATNSTSTTLAATANAVKQAYDLANSYKGTVTSIKLNHMTYTPTDGLIEANVAQMVTLNGTTIIPNTIGAIPLGNLATEDALNNVLTIIEDNEYVTATAITDLNDRLLIVENNNSGSIITEADITGWGFTKNTGTITGISANGTSVAMSGVANIPAASTSAYGVTKLSSATNSTSTTLAATASAVKAAYDLANSYKGTITSVQANGTSIATSGTANIPAATTSKYGVTKLSDATNSTSTTLAATASAVKAAYDLANTYKGTVTSITINGTTKNQTNGVIDLGTIPTEDTINNILTIIEDNEYVTATAITDLNERITNLELNGGGGSSGANVQAVDTGDVIGDITVDYATKTYVDGLVGNINSILESIINGNEINEVFVNIVETYLAAPVPKEKIYDVICVLSKPLDVKQTATLYYLDGENQPQTLSLVVEYGQTEFVFEQVMINHIEPDMYSVVIGEIEEEDANGIKVTLRSNFKFKYVYS
jgi:predicted component of type VI protein secretion system